MKENCKNLKDATHSADNAEDNICEKQVLFSFNNSINKFEKIESKPPKPEVSQFVEFIQTAISHG